MSEPLLLPVKPDTLNAKDKAALRNAGVIVIEHDNPSELRLLRPTAELDSCDLLRCAMQGLMNKDGMYGRRAARSLCQSCARSGDGKGRRGITMPMSGNRRPRRRDEARRGCLPVGFRSIGGLSGC